ncbi:MAG: ribosome assembly cofactor RimP [Bacteroidales bacterium]
MIKKDEIYKIVSQNISGSEITIVDIQVGNSNNIRIVLDALKGVNIEDCVKINRLIESNFNRDTEDYQLEVSSYSISDPFIIPLHYIKNLDRQVEIQLKNGRLIKGLLKKVTFDENGVNIIGIELSNKKKIKEEGKKKKIEIEELTKVDYSEIQKAKLQSVF